MDEPEGSPGPARGAGRRPGRRPATRVLARAASRAGSAGTKRLTILFGGPARTRVIVVLACVLALASADIATVGAAAIQLRKTLHISNTDIGLLVAVNSVVAAIASVPFGMLADRVRRTWMLSFAVAMWGLAMVGSATASSFHALLLWRLGLGLVTAAAGPAVASLVGDYFSGGERGQIYSYILTGELIGAGVGFAVTGDVASLSWQAAFVILGLVAFPLAWSLFHLPEPARGGAGVLLPGAAAPADAAETSPPDSPDSATRDRRRLTLLRPDSPAAATAPAGGGAADRPQATDAQRLAAQRGIAPDLRLVRRARGKRMGLVSATRYVLAVKTNISLIVSSACGYYFLAGVMTFGIQFVHQQYNVNPAFANLLMIVVGGGAAVGIAASGPLGDSLLRRGHLNARILIAAVAASATVLLFIPALSTHSVVTALPYVVFAAAALSAQNPPIDAARLDIMPFELWGRAEGIRTFLRTIAQALAPLIFGFFSDYIGLRGTFLLMLLPLTASALFLFRAMRTYPSDVATAAAASGPRTERAA
jgi:MFS family permease